MIYHCLVFSFLACLGLSQAMESHANDRSINQAPPNEPENSFSTAQTTSTRTSPHTTLVTLTGAHAATSTIRVVPSQTSIYTSTWTGTYTSSNTVIGSDGCPTIFVKVPSKPSTSLLKHLPSGGWNNTRPVMSSKPVSHEPSPASSEPTTVTITECFTSTDSFGKTSIVYKTVTSTNCPEPSSTAASAASAASAVSAASAAWVTSTSTFESTQTDESGATITNTFTVTKTYSSDCESGETTSVCFDTDCEDTTVTETRIMSPTATGPNPETNVNGITEGVSTYDASKFTTHAPYQVTTFDASRVSGLPTGSQAEHSSMAKPYHYVSTYEAGSSGKSLSALMLIPLFALVF